MSAGGGTEAASGASERHFEKAIRQTMRVMRGLRLSDGRKLAEHEARLHEELFVALARQIPDHPRGLIVETHTQAFHLLRGRRGFNLESDQLNLALSHGRALLRLHPQIESADYRVRYHVLEEQDDVEQRGSHEFFIRRIERRVAKQWREIYACDEPVDSVSVVDLFLGTSPLLDMANVFAKDVNLGNLDWNQSLADVVVTPAIPRATQPVQVAIRLVPHPFHARFKRIRWDFDCIYRGLHPDPTGDFRGCFTPWQTSLTTQHTFLKPGGYDVFAELEYDNGDRETLNITALTVFNADGTDPCPACAR